MNINIDALKGVVAEVEASKLRQQAESDFQRDAIKRAVKQHQLDGKAIRLVLQRRAMGEAKRDEQDYFVHSYELALGGKKLAQEALERGASIREAAKVGGISTGAAGNLAKAVQKSGKLDTPHDADGVITTHDRAADTAVADAAPAPPGNPQADATREVVSVTPVPNAGAGTGTNSESCGPCPVSSANGAEKGDGLPSAKGKATDESPAARRHTSDDALAPALGTSQREDGAPPGPQDTPDDDWDSIAQTGSELTAAFRSHRSAAQ